MPRIGQILGRLFVSLVLLGGFVSAPFQHDHEEAEGHFAAAWGGHAHLHAVHTDAEIEAAEVHGQPQDWVAGAVERSWGWAAEAAPERAEIQLPVCLLRHACILRPGHDPPSLAHLIPRAPPV